jgi:hypothetical protein
MRPDVAAIVLNSSETAAAQIARALDHRHDLNAIHVIAHGAPGRANFAAGDWSAEALDDAAEDFSAIGTGAAGESFFFNDGGSECTLGTCAGQITALTAAVAKGLSEIFFVDPSVSALETILGSLCPEVEAIVLDRARPAARQIAEALADRRDLTAVRVIAHGEATLSSRSPHPEQRDRIRRSVASSRLEAMECT